MNSLKKCISMLAIFLQRATIILFVVGLVGCAATKAYREGNEFLAEGKIEQGLGKLEEAVRLDPKNAEYRIALASRRASSIGRLIMAGESAQRSSRLADAEKFYRQVLALESENVMALQGLDAIKAARRHRQIVSEAELLFKNGVSADYSEALEKLRIVFNENPNHKDAAHLKALIDDARAKDRRPQERLAENFRKAISLEFRDAPLKTVLEVISKVSGMNFFYDKDIRSDLKATIFAKNTTVEDALRLILVTNQLDQKILNGNSILIYPNTPQKLKDYQTLAVRSFFLANADVKSVSSTLKTIVKTKDLVVDERLGIIIMRDTPEAIRMAERIVALQDLSDPEVMLDVEVMEIKRSRLMELGIQWPSQLTLSPLQLGGAPLTLEALGGLNRSTIQAGIGGFSINARNENQDGNILANPRIRVRNKEKAKIQIGDRVPVITTTSTSTGFVSESVNYVDVGLKLEVEPNIYLDNDVSIKVNLEVSNLVREILSKSGTLSYQIGTRGANTVLRLRDGETQILAGLISDEDRSVSNRVPGLGALPIAGRLFGSQKDDTQRSEILLSITPRVVRALQRPDMLAAEFESGTEAAIGSPGLRLSTVEPAADSTKEGRRMTPDASKSAIDAGTKGKDDRTQEISGRGEVLQNGTEIEASGKKVAPSVGITWQAPAQVKADEQFSAVLRITSQGALQGLPLLIGFDPQTLQVVSVEEGDFFKQGSAKTTFSHRVDAVQGKVFVAMVRQRNNGTDGGVNGAGNLVTVTFKARRGTAATKLQLLSATPESNSGARVALPLAHVLRIIGQ